MTSAALKENAVILLTNNRIAFNSPRTVIYF